MKKVAFASAVLIALAFGDVCWGVCVMKISDLTKSPTPPNPVKVLGRVTAVSPVMLSDGGGTIAVNGLTAEVGDFLVVIGDWDGSALTMSGPTEGFVGPARTQMVYVQAGSFLMGNNGSEPYSNSNELPQHSVYLSGYWIGKYEVTRGEYRQFVNAGGYSNPAYWSSEGWSWKVNSSRTRPYCWPDRTCFRHGEGGCNLTTCSYAFTQTDNHPVVGASYYEAEAFCSWAGGRLPTEAEWERAARWTGSYPRVYPWGSTWEQQKCNNWNDSLYTLYQTAPVGSYPSGASPSGCNDMAGNVWEWVKDWYGSNYYSQTPQGGWVNPQGPAGGSTRAVRGAGWHYGTGIDGYRCAYRNYCGPFDYGNVMGFRLAR